MTPDEFEARNQSYTFTPAPAGSSPEERSAAALEFIAKQLGDIASSLDFLSGDQMQSLISNLPS
jgi:hypothetical protein